MKTLRTDTKTYFLPPSWEGTAVESEVNREMQGLTRVTAKSTRHCIASVLVSGAQPTLGSVQPPQIAVSPLQPEPTVFPQLVLSFKGPPENHCINKGKKKGTKIPKNLTAFL